MSFKISKYLMSIFKTYSYVFLVVKQPDMRNIKEGMGEDFAPKNTLQMAPRLELNIISFVSGDRGSSGPTPVTLTIELW